MNRSFRRAALCLVAGMTAAPSLASTWVYIGKNTYGSVYDVDWDSLRREGNVVTFTLRVKYGPDSPPGQSDGYEAHRRANCADRSYSDVQTDYMKNGAVLRSSGQEETRTAPPNSIAAEVVNKACAK